MIYKTFTIVEEHDMYASGQFMIYPTADGIQHDYDYSNESYHYCGNCKWFCSLEEAKEEIDFIVENLNHK